MFTNDDSYYGFNEHQATQHLADKRISNEEITRLEQEINLHRDTIYSKFGDQLTQFKESAIAYSKITNKVYKSIHKAEGNTKNLRDIQKSQERLIAKVILNTDLPPVSERSKLFGAQAELQPKE